MDKVLGEKPTIGVDYKSFGESIRRDDKRTALVLRDRESVTTHAHTVSCKGTGGPHIVRRIIADIDGMGHTEILLKGDGEPALTQVMEAVKARRPQQTILVQPPAYDPQSNGAIEKAVDQFMGQMRTLKLSVESRIGSPVSNHWKIIDWLVEHACSTINRGQVGHDGKTPFQRLRGRVFDKRISSVSAFTL